MSEHCPFCGETTLAELAEGGFICLDCEKVWGIPKESSPAG